LIEDVPDDGEKVGESFAGAGFCNSDDIPACEEERDGLGLDGERFLILSFFDDGEYFVCEPAVIPVEDWVEDILASDLDVARFLAVPLDIFGVIVFDFLSFSI
jgi:hypothetical protein